MAAAVVRWRFDDPVSLVTYTFVINPKAGGSPQYQKQFKYENTAAPNGKVLVFQGRNQPIKLSWDGTILQQAELDAITEWFNKAYQIKVTDDLGRQFMVIIEKFSPKRERSVLYPFKHSYTIDATVVDW